jgi:hypothetical protein
MWLELESDPSSIKSLRSGLKITQQSQMKLFSFQLTTSWIISQNHLTKSTENPFSPRDTEYSLPLKCAARNATE